ncbi:DNA-3-methyladenine glycosylase I [Latilactobacillus fuchuensis]|uniref:Methyladenine glycosylase family protein n=2 Tax=Latilactobacillus fuchuensis TaxID=164393 RepID=A0A2N9DWJ2_9LACO|nr:DNA-3-methyladenine glycosylase I [Latilactobacillus fuchuensis]KRL58823.1 methyladenine glycosylase family protein [Latilactobacillus fuchuensis DSM 14340 = JCM 11249]MCP8858033.1 DNA-3-methyladenine glycosylase I [Latilactobacillus fuchuensis]SPC39028.1 Methyladenine glycosylase family protein [Latilactobacillus fuchuensis]
MVELSAQQQFETNPDGVQAYQAYFGTPTYDDRLWFVLLTVGVFQVGLSWQAAASKLPVYRAVFAGMSIEEVAQFDEADVERLQQDERLIRNPRKIRAVIQNARAILAIQATGISFSEFLWDFVGGQPQLLLMSDSGVTERSAPISTQLAKALKKRGFKFVGPVVTHMMMLAGGLLQVADD